MMKNKSSLAKRNLEKFVRNKLAIAGVTILFIMIVSAILAPLITKYDPTTVDTVNRLQQPSSEHIFGTDSIGRDVFTRILYGGRYSMLIGLTGALGSGFIGIVLGCISGYFGGKTDAAILYISEMFMSIPQFLLVIILVGFFGRGMVNLIVIFAVTGWTYTHRIVRGKILSLREETYVESCRANGVSGLSIMFRHLLPNTLGPVVVSITILTAGFVLSESALSFIGLGVEANITTWGTIINAAKSLVVMQKYPLLWITPGVAISLFVLGINFFGDGLRDVYDPGQ